MRNKFDDFFEVLWFTDTKRRKEVCHTKRFKTYWKALKYYARHWHIKRRYGWKITLRRYDLQILDTYLEEIK